MVQQGAARPGRDRVLLLLFVALAAALAGAGQATASQVRVLEARVQLRTLEEVFPGAEEAAVSRLEAAVITLWFDQPVYVARGPNGTALSLPSLKRFAQLRPEYRQALYGLARLECPGGKVFESFPPAGADDGAHSTSPLAWLPAHMLVPVPQFQYQAPQLRWLNDLSRPERDSASGVTNALSYLVLLSRAVSRAADGHSVERSSVLRATELPHCSLVLPAPEEQGWQPPARLLSVGGDPVLLSPVPALQFDTPRSVHLHVLAPAGPSTPGSGSASSSGMVFLQEDAQVDANERGAGGPVMDAVCSKLMQISYPVAEQVNEYAAPWISQAMSLYFVGKGGVGSSVAGSMSTSPPLPPVQFSFLELENKVAGTSSAGAADGAETATEAGAGAGSKTAAFGTARGWSGEMLEQWRVSVQARLTKEQEEVVRDGSTAASSATTPTARWAMRHSSVAAPRLLERVAEAAARATDEVDQEERAAGAPRFEEVRARQEAAAGVGFGPGTKGASAAEPGPLAKQLISEMIPELTKQLTAGLADALTEAICENVADGQADGLRLKLAEAIGSVAERTVPSGVAKAVSVAVPSTIETAMPATLAGSLVWTTTRTLTRGLVHSLAYPVALMMARPSEEEYVCSLCVYQQNYCDMCSWTADKRTRFAYNVDYFADFYSDMFAEHFGGGTAAPGFPSSSQI